MTSYHFRPALFPSLAAGVLIGLFLGLGIWQLQRAEEKKTLVEDLERRAREPAVVLSPPVGEAHTWRNRRITAEGRFVAERQLLLDNQVYKGRVGYHVLTPFQLSGTNSMVLVDRGWVPAGENRSVLPTVSSPSTEIQIQGTAYVHYSQGFHIGEIDTNQTSWPRVIQYVDYEEVGHRLGTALMPLTVRLDPNGPYGYVRDWDSAPFSPQRHLGYAVQWFALAAALIVIFLALSIRRDRPADAHD